MTKTVTGTNMPDDLLAVLKKYGMPDRCISFKIEASAREPLLLSFTCYMRMPKEGETFERVEETRVYRLQLVK